MLDAAKYWGDDILAGAGITPVPSAPMGLRVRFKRGNGHWWYGRGRWICGAPTRVTFTFIGESRDGWWMHGDGHLIPIFIHKRRGHISTGTP